MSVLTMVLLGLVSVSVVLTAVTQLAAHLVLRRRRPRVPEASLPPISVLKPMKGLDEGLEENLRALAAQDYPRFELLCGTRDPHDPALDVARRVAADFPGVVRVVSGPGVAALNPKVSNLIEIAQHARFGTRLISDSNVRPRPGYLRAMASELVQPGVGLVHSVLAGTGEESLGALFENLHLNAWLAQAVSGADALAGHACVVGKSILYRHGDLQALGGLESVKDVLAEDYLLGQTFQEAGFEVRLSPFVLPTVSRKRSVGEFWARHLRWAQMRRWVSKRAYALELLSNPIPLLTLAIAVGLVAGLEAVGGPEVFLGLIFAGVLKCAADGLLFERLRAEPVPLRKLACIPVKDFMVLGMWLVGLGLRRIHWRGNVMWLAEGSNLLAHPPPRSLSALRARRARTVA